MGPQQVLRAAACSVLIAGLASPAVGSPRRDRAAVIDLGPPDEAVRGKLAAALVDAGLEPVIGDGVEDALAGASVDRDGLQLAAEVADAQRAFGQLDCKAAIGSAQTALGIAAARQAAGLAVPELPRAWAYVLLCADRTGDANAASVAATRLRALGGDPSVDAAMLARYPEVDALSNREVVDAKIEAEVAGATIWIDFAQAGTSPLLVELPAGAHVIAAASGARRGYVSGTVVKTQPTIAVPMADQAGKWTAVASRVASWHGQLPSPDELAWVLGQVHARAALIRHGDVVEAWGQAGRADQVHRLGDDDGTRPLAEADHAAQLIADRVHGWNDRSPDPDKPLLVESPRDKLLREHPGDQNPPTKWWVYASIAGAVVAGAIVIYAHDTASDTQRVELHYP